jgi:hypothetical protein
MKTIRPLLAIAIALACAVRAGAAPDPGAPGPLAVTTAEYDFGDAAFTPPDLGVPVELRASVHYPTDLSSGPFPLVLFLHGKHSACHDGSTELMAWPCPPPSEPIPSYQGYDYVADVLASHGYVVVSVSANGINAADNLTMDSGALARAQLLQRHLDLWEEFDTVGGAPFGSTFVGRVDLQRVGTMGHSRGGEGVVRHYGYNAGLGSPYGIKAVFPVAPVDDNRSVANDVPLAVLLPYCDGDVSALEGIHYFDDARYNVAGDRAPKHTILVRGANHNFYNTIWTPGFFPAGAVDDWFEYVTGGDADPYCGDGATSQRLSPAQQRGTGLAYIAGFFRAYLGGETALLPFLTGDSSPPPSAMTDAVLTTYHPAECRRRDVNRLLDAAALSIDTLGGAVSEAGMLPYALCGGDLPEPAQCLPGEDETRQPSTSTSLFSPKRGLSQLHTGWSGPATATYHSDVPVGSGDVCNFFALQFRASVDFTDPRNAAGMPQDLSVVLTDGAAHSASVRAGDFTHALDYPPGAVGPVPKVVLQGVRIPLSAFKGVDLTDVRSVDFRFDQRPQGGILLSDLAFVDACSRPVASCTAGAPTVCYAVPVGPEGPPGSPTCSDGIDEDCDGLIDAADPDCSGNTPPDCAGATADRSELWPANRRFVDVDLHVTDPDNDAVTTSITSITQDEPVSGRHAGKKCPDAAGIGTASASLRAERVHRSDGRVYHVAFTADDGHGGSCNGVVTVCVPHDMRPGHTCIDEGDLYDATGPCS